MEVLKRNPISKRMIRFPLKSWAAIAAAAGTLCSFDQARKYLVSMNLYATSTEDTGWLSQILSKKDSKIEPVLSDAKVNTILRNQEFTRCTNRKIIGPVAWFETNHYNANNPIEDRHCECYLGINDAYFFGIIDGHSGWHCSETLRLRLPLYVSLALMSEEERHQYISQQICLEDIVEYLGNPNDDCPSFKLPGNFAEKQKRIKSGSVFFAEKATDMVKNLGMGDILKYTYLSLDRDITREAIPDGKCNEPIWTGLSGAVTVGAYIKGHDIYVANTGDCRALVGFKTFAGGWLDIPMSDDHTTDNVHEIERLNREHPDEPSTVVLNDRLLGQLQPLRSFGDVVYKWNKELHQEVLDIMYGQPVVPKHIYKTPPYLTAQPDVNLKKIDKEDRFLILATDGLWETISNQMAVKIVGEYLDDLKKGSRPEENGATRLIRFALGHSDRYRLADMLQIPTDRKRNFHDDITVTIIYFDSDYKHLQSKL